MYTGIPNCKFLFQTLCFAAYQFQANLIRTMMQIENTFFDLASKGDCNCLVICDRGTMDATACKNILNLFPLILW